MFKKELVQCNYCQGRGYHEAIPLVFNGVEWEQYADHFPRICEVCKGKKQVLEYIPTVNEDGSVTIPLKPIDE